MSETSTTTRHRTTPSVIIRRILSILCAALVLLFGAVTLTVPMFDATAPAIITVALAATAFFLWPRRSKSTADQS